MAATAAMVAASNGRGGERAPKQGKTKGGNPKFFLEMVAMAAGSSGRGGEAEREHRMRRQTMKSVKSVFYLQLLLLLNCCSGISSSYSGDIIFAMLGRPRYAFDIYSVNVPNTSLLPQPPLSNKLRLTDGQSVNYNGHFPNLSSSLLSLFFSPPCHPNAHHQPPLYVTDRNGSSSIYLDAYAHLSRTSPRRTTASYALFQPRLQISLLQSQPKDDIASMKDRPSIFGDYPGGDEAGARNRFGQVRWLQWLPAREESSRGRTGAGGMEARLRELKIVPEQGETEARVDWREFTPWRAVKSFYNNGMRC